MALTNLSQITTSGIATGTDLNIRNITGVAATFTGSVTVGGTLTYEDVTNIDSVGLITARSGINITGGDLKLEHSSPRITLKDTDGTSQNSQIFQTGGSLFVDTRNNTFDGSFVMRGQGSGSGTEKLRIDGQGRVGIATDDPTAKLDVNGTVNVSGVSTFSDNVSIASTNVAALTITPPSNFPVEDFIGGVSIANTENKTYPTTSGFFVGLGLNQNIEVGGTQVINPSTPGGYNYISGIRNILRKENDNTQDVERSYYYGIDQRFNWQDQNTCKQYVGILDLFTYTGIDTNGRTSSSFDAGRITLAPTEGGQQTVTNVTSKDLTLRGLASTGISTVAITNVRGYSPYLVFYNFSTGTHNNSITNYSAFETNPYWGTSGSSGTLNATITNYYGLKLTAPSNSTGLTVTNNYGVYSGWSDSINYFAGNIGIGTQNPGTKLEVSGTGSPTLRISDLDGTNQFGQIIANNGTFVIESRNDTSDGQIIFRGRDASGTNEYARFDENGVLGIGTNNPNNNSKLHIYRGSAGCDLTITSGNANAADINLGDIDDHDIGRIRYNNQTNAMLFNTNGSERLRIKNDGKVGIGTDNPDNTLHLYDSAAFASFTNNADTGESGILFRRHDNNQNRGKVTYSFTDDALLFRASNNGSGEDLRITSAGLVGIGTDVPSSDLHVFRSTAASSIIDAAAGDALLTLRNAGNSNWSGINFTRERNTGTNVTGGSIWMPSDTSNNSATLYLQTQSASANAGVDSALTNDNGVRLKLASQPGGNGGNSAFTVEVGATEKFRVHADGESKFTVGTNKFVKFYAATHDDEADLGAGIAFSRPSDGADMLSGIFSHSNTGLGIAARDHVTILTGGTSTVSDTEERVRISSNGAVGIGTNSPDDRLHVLGGNIQVGKIEETGYETTLGNNNLSFNRSAASYINQKGTGDIRFRYSTNNITWMHMEGSSGHIGIGTDAPDHRLEVFGSPGPGDLSIKSAASAAGGTEHSKLRFRVRNPSNQESTLASIHVKSDANWGGNLLFGTKTASGGLSESTVERLRIKHDGNVGIGTQAYGDIDPLAPLHVSSYAPTTAITDHQHLRNAAQILCQTSNNVNNSRSGIMFSGALHSTDGCSAGIIANHENVAENSETTSLSFYTSYQEVIGERFRIFADGQFDMNGVRNIFETFRLTNNVAYEFDYTVPNEGGYGNSFRIEAGYNHYYAATYGAHRTAWVSTRGTNLGYMIDQNQNTSQAGGWSFSKPNSTTLRITKSAGTYGGQGYGFLHIRYNHF